MGTHGIDTKSFANQINLNMQTCWAILRETIQDIQLQKDETGEYIYMKDPNKAMMRLFKMTTEDNEEDDVDDEL